MDGLVMFFGALLFNASLVAAVFVVAAAMLASEGD